MDFLGEDPALGRFLGVFLSALLAVSSSESESIAPLFEAELLRGRLTPRLAVLVICFQIKSSFFCGEVIWRERRASAILKAKKTFRLEPKQIIARIRTPSSHLKSMPQFLEPCAPRSLHFPKIMHHFRQL